MGRISALTLSWLHNINGDEEGGDAGDRLMGHQNSVSAVVFIFSHDYTILWPLKKKIILYIYILKLGSF